MNKKIAFVAAIVFWTAASTVQAILISVPGGRWPESWPKELEPLRKQAQSAAGPSLSQEHYHLPFKERDEFEAAWPHLLKVKSPGAPIILVRPRVRNGKTMSAVVCVHSPAAGTEKRANAENALPRDRSTRQGWTWTTYIELFVDGEVVDLNRIELPADTPIIDERFQGETDPSPDKGG